jgi:hypothetical protein
MFITDELVDLVVKETNRCSAQQLANRILLKFSRLWKWRDTSSQEIQIFITGILLQGIIWESGT